MLLPSIKHNWSRTLTSYNSSILDNNHIATGIIACIINDIRRSIVLLEIVLLYCTVVYLNTHLYLSLLICVDC